MDAIELQIFLKVIIAMALGGIIGIERELARKPAGIRTHMFVAGAAALVITVSQVVIEQFSQLLPAVNADPIRVVEAVIVGISTEELNKQDGVLLDDSRFHSVGRGNWHYCSGKSV